jgi:hypothetical protein
MMLFTQEHHASWLSSFTWGVGAESEFSASVAQPLAADGRKKEVVEVAVQRLSFYSFSG